MNVVTILQTIRGKKGMGYNLLATKCGYASKSGVCNRFTSESMTVTTLVKFLEAMDCELIIKDKAGNRETYVVTNEGR